MLNTLTFINVFLMPPKSQHPLPKGRDNCACSCNISLAFIGISHSARGYLIVSVLETMKTYSSEDGLTEEALVAKLRTCRYHHLFLNTSLRHNSSGLYPFSFLLFKAVIFLEMEK